MAFLTSLLECVIGHLLYRFRARDAKLFTATPPFAAHPESTIPIYSPEYGQSSEQPSSTPMDAQHTQVGANRFPALTWSVPVELEGRVKEWLLVVEDPDAPLPRPVVHGLYYAIAASNVSLNHADFEVVDEHGEGEHTESKANSTLLKGGFRYGQNRPGTVWAGPRPVMAHGPHRYFFQVVGLGQELDWRGIRRTSQSSPLSREELAMAIEGKVVAWGLWVGTFERHWGS